MSFRKQEDVISNIYSQLASSVPKIIEDSFGRGCNPGYYPPVVSRHNYVLEFSKGLDANEQLKMIDIGCGQGYLLLCIAASYPKMRCFGIDINDEALVIISEWQVRLSLGNITLIHGDVFDHSFDGYDYVYTYCPIPQVDNELLHAKFYHHIWYSISLGTKWYEAFIGDLCMFPKRSGWIIK